MYIKDEKRNEVIIVDVKINSFFFKLQIKPIMNNVEYFSCRNCPSLPYLKKNTDKAMKNFSILNT